MKVEDRIGTIYSDNATDLIAAARCLKARLVTSRAYVNENKSVIEREIRTMLEGTRADLEQAGTGVKLWPLAAQHHAMALNLTERFDSRSIPCEDRFGEAFEGLMVPFKAKVLYWNNPKQNVTGESKFSATGVDGAFLGYHIQPGFNWRKEYLVAPLQGFKQALEAGNLQVLRSKRMELPPGKFVFPLLFDETHQPPPRLNDQDCYHHEDPVDPFEDLFNDYPRSSHDEAGQGGGEEPDSEIRIDGMTMRDLFGDDDEEDPLSLNPDLLTQLSQPYTVSRSHHHVDQGVPRDPTRVPDGEPCRLVSTGMELDLLGIEGVLEDRQTRPRALAQVVCRPAERGHSTIRRTSETS